MHDPCTQAFVIPWRYRWSTLGKTPWRYWEPLITIWHVDPERGGSDDSCGWSRPPLSATTREIVKSLAGDEAGEPMLFALDARTNSDPIQCERFIFGSIMLMSRCLVNRGVIRRPVKVADAQRWAAEMTYNRVDSFLGTFCFKSGYHSNTYSRNEELGITNSKEEDHHWREDQARSFYSAIAGWIMRERRWWFQHPKWHVIHWKRRLDRNKPIGSIEDRDAPRFAYKYWGIPLPIVGWQIQIHPLQQFKRWAFSRCSRCGGRFHWGSSVGTNSWNSGGPSWHGEKDVYHMDCDRPTSDGAYSAKPDPSCG